jgi:5-methylcytosine-specific restriction protein A
MPTKPKKPCAFSGCPNLTDARYCPEHQKLVNQRYNKYNRDPNHNKRYGSSWSKISKAYRRANPLCEQCKSEGKLVPAELVHHIKPLSDGGTNETDNLQSLCRACHSRLHCKNGDNF